MSNIVDISYIKMQSPEFLQLSPLYIFSDPIEFQGYSFKSLYILLEAFKIDQEKKRKSFLEHFLTTENIRSFYSTFEYDSKFNKSKIESFTINNSSIAINSVQFKTLMLNIILTMSSQNIAYKYSLLSSKKANLKFSELDEKTNNFYLSSEIYSNLLKSA